MKEQTSPPEGQEETCTLEMEELEQKLAAMAVSDSESERKSFDEFVHGCNARHLAFELTPRWSNSALRLNSIEVRFSAPRYNKYYSARRWQVLNDGLRQLSQGVLQITTTEELYLNGVIDIAVAARSPAYREYALIRALKWLTKQITEDNEDR